MVADGTQSNAMHMKDTEAHTHRRPWLSMSRVSIPTFLEGPSIRLPCIRFLECTSFNPPDSLTSPSFGLEPMSDLGLKGYWLLEKCKVAILEGRIQGECGRMWLV